VVCLPGRSRGGCGRSCSPPTETTYQARRAIARASGLVVASSRVGCGRGVRRSSRTAFRRGRRVGEGGVEPAGAKRRLFLTIHSRACHLVAVNMVVAV